MGDLVVSEFVSLDGVFEDPGGAEGYRHGGWTFRFDRGPEGERFKLQELRDAGAHLLGRVTYEGFAAAWPGMEHAAGEYGEKMNAFPKYVVSRTLETAAWNNSTIVRGTLEDEVRKLTARVDGDLLVAGSGTLVRGLLAADLVDELRLMVFPIVLGSGRRLFADDAPEPSTLELSEARPLGGGTVLLRYRRPA